MVAGISAAIAAAITVAVAAAAPGWTSKGEHVGKDGLQASFSYQTQEDSFGFPVYRSQLLTVTRGDRRLYIGPVCTSVQVPAGCAPAYAYAKKPSLFLRNIWGDERPETVLELNSGGAHCCAITDVVLDRNGHAALVEHDWADHGYRGQWHGGVYYFVSDDARFDYEFTDHADSLFPIQVWRLDSVGRFVDATRSRLDLVGANAHRLYAGYEDARGKHADVRGWLAAWCADEHLLGEQETCITELQLAVRTGVLLAGLAEPQGQRYVTLLQRDLAKWGYLRH